MTRSTTSSQLRPVPCQLLEDKDGAKLIGILNGYHARTTGNDKNKLFPALGQLPEEFVILVANPALSSRDREEEPIELPLSRPTIRRIRSHDASVTVMTLECRGGPKLVCCKRRGVWTVTLPRSIAPGSGRRAVTAPVGARSNRSVS